MYFAHIRGCLQSGRWPEGCSPSPVELLILVGILHLGDKMSETQTAIAALQAADANLAAAFTTLSGKVGALITTVTDEPTAIADAVTAAIKAAGGDPDDAVNAAAIQAAADADTKLVASMEDLGTHADAAEAAASAPAPPPAPTPEPAPEPTPAPQPVTVNAPAPITGVAGTPVSGQFTASGGTAPYTFKADGAVGDFTVTADGFYAMNPASPMTGSVNITATDSVGEASEPVSVSISISPVS